MTQKTGQPDSVMIRRGDAAGVSRDGEPSGPLPPDPTVGNPTEPSPETVAALMHQKRDHRRGQRWTTPARVAAYFGVTRGTVCAWLRRRYLGARMVTDRHYTDERPRKTARGRWRIFEADLAILLRELRVRSKPMLGPRFWTGGGK